MNPLRLVALGLCTLSTSFAAAQTNAPANSPTSVVQSYFAAFQKGDVETLVRLGRTVEADQEAEFRKKFDKFSERVKGQAKARPVEEKIIGEWAAVVVEIQNVDPKQRHAGVFLRNVNGVWKVPLSLPVGDFYYAASDDLEAMEESGPWERFQDVVEMTDEQWNAFEAFKKSELKVKGLESWANYRSSVLSGRPSKERLDLGKELEAVSEDSTKDAAAEKLWADAEAIAKGTAGKESTVTEAYQDYWKSMQQADLAGMISHKWIPEGTSSQQKRVLLKVLEREIEAATKEDQPGEPEPPGEVVFERASGDVGVLLVKVPLVDGEEMLGRWRTILADKIDGQWKFPFKLKRSDTKSDVLRDYLSGAAEVEMFRYLRKHKDDASAR